MKNTSIKAWAEDDRPREKLMNKGVDSLSNSELLAIILNKGTHDKTAVQLAKEILSSASNELQRLEQFSVKDLVNLKIKGLGPVKAIAIAAAMELGRRRIQSQHERSSITKSTDIVEYLKLRLEQKKHEVFAVVFLSQSLKINHFEVISEGGLTQTVVDPRIVIKKAMEHNAVNLILCHNHPGGGLKPSKQDEMVTSKLTQAAMLFDIKILDHVIVSNNGHFSFADNEML